MRVAIIAVLLSGWAAAAVNVPITVQESIYPGSTSGVARSNEPVSVGVPLVQSDVPCGSSNPASCTGVSSLGLAAGPSFGQFRCLAVWPDQSCKWVLVDTQVSSLTAGGTASVTLQAGSGNFGGSNLATDNGTTITVVTGAATFTLKKSNHNGLDIVDVGATHVVLTGASSGLILQGPDPVASYPGNVTCSPTSGGTACTNSYSLANDSSSTCSIEENGPARAGIKCTGALKSSGGVAYLKVTVRYQFFAGKTYARMSVVVQNADLGASGTFASAYKGFQALEYRAGLNLSGTLNYTIANHTATATTGTLSGSDNVYLYQGASLSLKNSNACDSPCVKWTTDQGYVIAKNGSNVTTGTNVQYPQGWADVSDGSGVGVQIGIHQMAAMQAKSLEFYNGGTEARIGIWAAENSQPYYHAWPQWQLTETYLNFHAAAPASLPNDFLRYQHSLLGRAARTHYNATGVFPYQIIDPAEEDAYYIASQSTANPSTIAANQGCATPTTGPCVADNGTTDNVHGTRVNMWRWWVWNNGGGDTQAEFRFSNLAQWLSRGYAGRYMSAMYFYWMQSSIGWPHADGFTWRSQAAIDGFGRPTATSANSSLGWRYWFDQEHGHWWGQTFAYFMTGNEFLRDAMESNKDWHMNASTYQTGVSGGLWNTRAVGVNLANAARFADYLTATGDTSSAATVLTNATSDFNTQVKATLCVSGYPAGCTDGLNGPWTTQGVSRERGVRWGTSGDTSATYCGVSHVYRASPPFQHGILIQGLLDFRNVKGSAWSDYWLALDLAYGMGRWSLEEMFVDGGGGRWDQAGWHYYQAIDRDNACAGPGESPDANFAVMSQQTVWYNFIPFAVADGSVAWSSKLKLAWQQVQKNIGISAADVGSVHVAQAIYYVLHPPASRLTALTLTGFTDNGGGSYTVSWTVPPAAQSYRIKWGTKTIVDWIGYDPTAGAFTGNPATTQNWFASTDAASIPSPGTAGATQSLTIATGQAGLSSANFAVKAYVLSGSGALSGGKSLYGGRVSR